MSPIQVGIMHGRLSAPTDGRFQSFPAGTWREEFAQARVAGLACIEWIYEVPHEDENPLRTAEGVLAIKALVEDTGVGVWSVCADYYMERHLVRPDGSADFKNVDHLRRLIGQAGLLGARYIVLPFVDQSRLASQVHADGAIELLRRLAPEAEAAGIELHLETDLSPSAFASLITAIGHSAVRVNYDIGNSASLGYNPNEELAAYGDKLGSVHIKDRVRGGATQPLRMGSADFQSCFAQFKRVGFDRWFILQAARGKTGGETELAIANRMMVEAWAAEAGLG